MLFSSIVFLYYFLPIVMILYFIVPPKYRNFVLMATSLVFYAWGEPKYIMLMVVSIIIGYFAGIKIEETKSEQLKKVYLIVSLVISFGFLGYFKYADFFIDNFNALTGIGIPTLKIALPIGISFYTFQILSYTVDVYRGDVPAQRSVVNFAAYVTMFPQLIAGPIVRYSDVAAELESRTITAEKIYAGISRFIVGLSKKILIANILGQLCTVFRDTNEKSIVFYWIYAIAFSMQIYFDFSGYSDMAIGLGKIFGFNFIENFNYPFISKSITEFWRRWHMSLGSWFRDYVYIPLGGNRVPKARWMFNILIVWMLTGLWHGAAWNFVMWGLFFAVLLMLEKLCINKILKKLPVFIQHIYVILLVILSFVIFNAADMKEVFEDICSMFGAGGLPLLTSETMYYLRSYAVVLIFGIIGCTPLIKNIIRIIKQKTSGMTLVVIAEALLLICQLLVITGYLVDGSFNPFLYFRF